MHYLSLITFCFLFNTFKEDFDFTDPLATCQIPKLSSMPSKNVDHPRQIVELD